MIDDGDAVAKAIGLVHVMRGDQHGELALFLDAREHFPDGDTRHGIESGGRLVEEENFGMMHESARDFETAAHTAGECLGLRAAPLGQVDEFEELVHRLLALLLRNAVELGVDAEILVEREIGIAGHRLRNHAQAAANVVGLRLHVETRDVSCASGDRDERGHHADQRGLPCTVGTEQPEDFALANAERDVVDGSEVAILLDDVRHRDRGRARRCAIVAVRFLNFSDHVFRFRSQLIQLITCSVPRDSLAAGIRVAPEHWPAKSASSARRYEPALRRSFPARVSASCCRPAASRRWS